MKITRRLILLVLLMEVLIMAKYVNKFTFDGQNEVLIEDVKAQNSIVEINNSIQDINDFLENIKPDYLKGKTMIVLGDSLVAGSQSQGTLGKTWIELMVTRPTWRS